MAHYQVFARKYRPQTFAEVIGQEAVITTLKNAIKNQRLAHAYLFCGSRGTGKTTLARVFAKALNCQNPTAGSEPCCACSSCKEIASGNSLDVLEIDGASHRGIDDIRQINETVGYATSSGGYKIYIIDEVHMLTKEAFNALLKTLEEPPPKVVFFFATTEPHKVLPTILSRCQRFNLNRIPLDKIIAKLQNICRELHVSIEEEALHLIARRSEGGLRDAESLLDQIVSFHENGITLASVSSILGMMPKDVLFSLDQAGKEGNLKAAFDIAHQVFSQGKDILHFVETLTEHFRTILLMKLGGKATKLLNLLEAEREKYEHSAKIYTQEQCLTILDFLVEAQQQIRFMASGTVALEALLLRILRIHQRVPVDYLIRRLAEIEQSMMTPAASAHPVVEPPPQARPKMQASQASSISEDPMPTAADLDFRAAAAPVEKGLPSPAPKPSSPPKEGIKLSPQEQCRYDTLLQFAAVELEGTIQKKPIR